ncbi:microsomal glutathione S-transferase 1-like [Planococcus citri]|uniref:microsomal glutathione S-transferase 1-like n=1 Tax=Planococcus citri TaxID=170843 RepID=UPI0031F93ED8
MLITLDINEMVFKSFLFYASILVGKTMIMSPLTARWRFKKRVFISSEDALLRGSRVGYDDEDIERIRRAHRNDIENIPMFLFAALMYMLTDPVPWVAINLFRLYTLLRFIYTYVYAIRVYPQPTRAIVWGMSYLINWYMIINSTVKFVSL